jgi:hypothetical protein
MYHFESTDNAEASTKFHGIIYPMALNTPDLVVKTLPRLWKFLGTHNGSLPYSELPGVIYKHNPS